MYEFEKKMRSRGMYVTSHLFFKNYKSYNWKSYILPQYDFENLRVVPILTPFCPTYISSMFTSLTHLEKA